VGPCRPAHIIGLAASRDPTSINWCTKREVAAIEVAAALLHSGDRKGDQVVPKRLLPIWNGLALTGILICSTGQAANGQERPRRSEKRSQVIAGTVVSGDIDTRTLSAALEALPRRPARIVVVDDGTELPAHEKQLRDLDGFVLTGSRIVYLRRQSETLLAAEYAGGPYVLMLAAIIWHEMAHTEGLDERHAQEREEDLWKQFVQRSLVDSGVGLTYLAEMRRRR
jgi:hypothetical protein